MKILIIDDEDAVRTFLRRVLEEESIECSDEGDPRRALDMLGDGDQERFDLILLDVVMPTMSGLEFLFERTGRKPCAD